MTKNQIIIDGIETAMQQMANTKVHLPDCNQFGVIDILVDFVDKYTDDWHCFDDYCVLYLRSAASDQTVTITWGVK